MTKNKKMMISALPFVALVVLLAVFCGIVSSKGYRLDMYIKIVFNEGIVLSLLQQVQFLFIHWVHLISAWEPQRFLRPRWEYLPIMQLKILR